MIQTQRKPYQLTFWLNHNRTGVAFQLEFDTRAEAERAFEQNKTSGPFKAGILYQWDKHTQESSLLASYPSVDSFE